MEGELVGDGESLFDFNVVNGKEMKDGIQCDSVPSYGDICIATNGAN
jgi:hypothetical protein